MSDITEDDYSNDFSSRQIRVLSNAAEVADQLEIDCNSLSRVLDEHSQKIGEEKRAVFKQRCEDLRNRVSSELVKKIDVLFHRVGLPMLAHDYPVYHF